MLPLPSVTEVDVHTGLSDLLDDPSACRSAPTCPSGPFDAVQPKSLRLGTASSDSTAEQQAFCTPIVTIRIVNPLAANQPLDLVAYGRLATGVKKAHLLCSYDERDGSVSYMSLEWAAMG